MYTPEDVHVKFIGNLQSIKATTDESCCCSVRFTEGRGSFSLKNTNNCLEGITKVIFYQKFPLGQNERKLCGIEMKMYLFQKWQFKSWSTFSWNGEENVVKRNVAACIESETCLREFFSRSLPEYLTFRKLIVSTCNMEFAHKELKQPPFNFKVRHLHIDLPYASGTTIDLLLRKFQNVDQLSLILTDLKGKPRNVILFKTFLQPCFFFKQLKVLVLSGLHDPIKVDGIFHYLTDQFVSHRLHCLKFCEVHLQWNSLNKFEEFVNDIKLYSQKRGKFEFVIESTIVTISDVDTKLQPYFDDPPVV